MRHQNSVFHGVLKHIPWDVFDRLVGEHGADSRVRRLNTKSQFVALLYGQLSGAASLREIVTGLASHAARLYHLGVRPVQRSTLADANAATAQRGVCRAVCGTGEAGASRFAPGARRERLSDRFHRSAAERSQRRMGALFERGLRRQGARDLRPRCRSSDLCRGQRGQGQRHLPAGPGNADRGRRHLCLRPRLLRLPLVGQAGCGGLPDRDPLQIQYPAQRGP